MGGIRRSGYEPVILAGEEGAAARSLQQRGERPRVALPHWRRRQAVTFLARLLRLARDLRHEQVSLLHVNLHLYGAHHGAILARLLRIPLVIHVRNILEPGWFVNKHARYLNAADRLICITRAVEDSVRAVGLKAETRVVYNGVDVAAFAGVEVAGKAFRVSMGIPEGALVFGVVGQVQPEKGILEFVEAAARLRIGEKNIHFAIVGDWEAAKRQRAEYVAAVEQVIESAGLKGRVHRLPFQERVAPVYAALDCLVLPSWCEPMGRVVIEAMAAEVPVIATDAGGVPEVLNAEGVSPLGLLVTPRDPASLAVAMNQVLQDPDAAFQRAQAARRVVAEKFSDAAYCRGVADVYEDVLSCPARVT